jgi:hypothetical protein
VKHIVKSREGVLFVVESEQRTVPYDIAFAQARPAAELRQHGDFTELHDIGQISATVVADKTPRIVGPQERRAAFRLIKGGKS